MRVMQFMGSCLWDMTKMLALTLAMIALGAIVVTIISAAVIAIIIGTLWVITSA